MLPAVCREPAITARNRASQVLNSRSQSAPRGVRGNGNSTGIAGCLAFMAKRTWRVGTVFQKKSSLPITGTLDPASLRAPIVAGFYSQSCYIRGQRIPASNQLPPNPKLR
jgi:hypothetical protein